jgi:hypothetical protein
LSSEFGVKNPKIMIGPYTPNSSLRTFYEKENYLWIGVI